MINKKVLKELNFSNIAKAKLIEANDVNPSTVNRWIASNHEKLTTAKNLEVISKALNLTQKEILAP